MKRQLHGAFLGMVGSGSVGPRRAHEIMRDSVHACIATGPFLATRGYYRVLVGKALSLSVPSGTCPF